MIKSKYIGYDLCQNRYNLDKKQIDKIITITENFYATLHGIKYADLTLYDRISVLGFYSEILDLVKNREECLEAIYELLSELKNNIEEKYVDISLVGGIANIALFLDPIVRKSGCFKSLQKSLNSVIIENATRKSTFYKNNIEWTCSSNFDVISGLSGVALYLFTLKDDEAIRCIKDINAYFVTLSEYKYVNNIRVPGWYIKRECLPTKEYREDFKEGCINYSISHGIAGPLYILSKGICEKIEIKGQKAAIRNIIEEYQNVSGYVDGVCIWPGMMQLNDYVKKINLCNNLRMSWCYGSLGVLQSMMIAGRATDDIKLIDWSEKQLLRISEIPIKRFYLDSPIICHGYAGASAIFRKLYDKKAEEKYLEKSREILDILLNMYNPDFPYGYKDYIKKYTQDGVQDEYSDKLSFLEGATGICAELIAFLKEDGSFERMLFLDV